MINSLQIMVYIALFQINFPLNISILQTLIIDITMFDILPSTKFGKYLFHFDEELDDDEAFSSVFREADIFKNYFYYFNS